MTEHPAKVNTFAQRLQKPENIPNQQNDGGEETDAVEWPGEHSEIREMLKFIFEIEKIKKNVKFSVHNIKTGVTTKPHLCNGTLLGAPKP